MPTGFTEKPGICTVCTLPLDIPRHVHQQSHPACAKEAERLYNVKRWGAISDEERKKWNSLAKGKARERRALVITHYGGKCACCGEARMEFLCIDHINGGGLAHRRVAGMGTHMYKWIIKNGFPDDLRVLCHNCNMSYGFYGYCPHQQHS